jgi:hypothetical protein
VQPAADAPTQQVPPVPQQSQKIPPVPTGDTASRVDPPTLVQPAVRPDTADDADTGSQPVTPGRR